MTIYTNFIGIDIGKHELVIGIHGNKSSKSFPNTQEGFDSFFSQYELSLNEALVVLETTGGYEKLFLKNFLKKKISVHRANTRQVKAFVKSLGNKGKTDALDAIALARYGYERHDRLTLYKPVEETLETLQSLAQRRLDLNQLLVQEKNRNQSPDNCHFVKKSCNEMIKTIQEQIQKVTKEIEDRVEQSPELIQKRKILMTIPGVGPITSLLLVILLPELGHLNRRQIASLVGLAPYPNESGTKIGYRRTKGGRQEVRSILFMAGMAASKSKSSLGEKNRKMVESGKKKMVALVATMRKIVVIANAKIKQYLQKDAAVVEPCGNGS